MIRQPVASVVVIALNLFVLASTVVRGATLPTTVPTTQQAVQATTDALNIKIESFKSEGDPLQTVIHRLAKTYKLQINVQWDALKKAAIDRKTPVFLTLRAGLTARELLKQVIRPDTLNLTIKDPDLVPRRSIRDTGEIVITTRIDMFAHFASSRKYPLPPAGSAAIDAVKAAVAPESWATTPEGVGGKITVDGNMMVVTQTDDNHRWMASMVPPHTSP